MYVREKKSQRKMLIVFHFVCIRTCLKKVQRKMCIAFRYVCTHMHDILKNSEEDNNILFCMYSYVC